MAHDEFPGDRTRQTRVTESELRRRGLQRMAILVGVLVLFPLGLVAGMVLMRAVQTTTPPPSSVAQSLPTASTIPLALVVTSTATTTSTPAVTSTPAPLATTTPVATMTPEPPTSTPLPTATPVPPPPTATRVVPPTPTPIPRRPKVGEVATNGQVTIVVYQLVDPLPPGQFNSPNPGNRFVAVDVVVTNISPRTASYNALYFKVRTADNREAMITVFTAQEPQLISGDLDPQEVARGWLTFEIPAGVPLATLIYEPIGGNRIVIDLRP